MINTEQIEIKYNIEDTEFTKEELKTIAFLNTQKPILTKITNKLVNKLVNEMLNNNISTDYKKWFEKAIIAFLSNFKL